MAIPAIMSLAEAGHSAAPVIYLQPEWSGTEMGHLYLTAMVHKEEWILVPLQLMMREQYTPVRLSVHMAPKIKM